MYSESEPQNQLLWRAAMLIFEAMKEHCTIDRAVLVSYAWDYLTTDSGGTFPATLMEPTQSGVTRRLVAITDRARRGVCLCPELGI
jgi:hypothetical protein